MTRSWLMIAALVAACSKVEAAKPLETATLAAAVAAPPTLALVPDEEAASIPTLGGIPVIPLATQTLDAFLASSDFEKFSRRPAAAYNTNDEALRIIKEEETLQLKAYELGGLWLIGYGHLMLEGEKDVITEAEADAFLEKDLAWCEGALERMVEEQVTHNEFSAAAAFCYNVGSGKTRGSSIVKKLNAGDREGAANAFLLWNRMNGKVMTALANRRARERTLFLLP